jgi:hypothetical protein
MHEFPGCLGINYTYTVRGVGEGGWYGMGSVNVLCVCVCGG